MGFMNEFPHSRMFDSDLREIVEMYFAVKELPDKWVAFEKLVSGEVEDLKNFVNKYFDNLNVQNEINNKLDGMAKDGSLSELIEPLFNAYKAEIDPIIAQHNSDINIMKNRMDTFTSLTEGSTTGDAELIDGRIDYKGNVHNNIGEHIRDVASQLSGEINNISEALLIENDGNILVNSKANFEQGNFTSAGDEDNEYWIKTPIGELLENGFTIYNPDKLRFGIGVYDSNGTFQYNATIGNEPIGETIIFEDKLLKVDYLNDYKYRLHVARKTYDKLSPEQNTLTVYRECIKPNEYLKKTTFRKPIVELSNNVVYHITETSASSGTEGAIYESEYYRLSNLIRLFKGETIRAYGSGGKTTWSLSEFNSDGIFVKGLVQGNELYRIYEYTADHDMYVRISGLVTYYSTGNFPVITEENLIHDTLIYTGDSIYSDSIKESPLYGKTITLMGDSLAHGSITGNDCVWLHHLALKYNMTEHNMGINGNAFTQGKGSGTPMCERYTQIPESDYIVVEGGANDKNSDAPLGTVSDTTPTTYAGAIYTVINGIRTMYPKAKLVFLTDYNRYPSKYRAYVDMMLQVCARYSVPCFNNFENAGVDVCSDAMKVWQDEGYVLTGTANVHFTPEVYRDVLLPKYEAFLLAQ